MNILTPRAYHVSDAFTQFRRFICIKKTPLRAARLLADTKKTRHPPRVITAQAKRVDIHTRHVQAPAGLSLPTPPGALRWINSEMTDAR